MSERGDLPTEPGWYARTLAVDWGLPMASVYALSHDGHWYQDERRIRRPETQRLTRLVPVTGPTS